MKKISIIGGFLLAWGQFFAQTISPTGTQNYIYSKNCLDADCIKKAETVQYFDGLGRPKQIVGIKASPAQKDVVSHIEYDMYGRQSKSYLPVPQTGSQNGAFYENPLNNAADPEIYGAEKIYSEQVIENAPLTRIKKSYNVGEAWKDKPVSYSYNTNTSANEVKKYGISTTWVEGRTDSQLGFTGAYYPVNTLMKTSVTDEDGNTTTEYKNGKGQTVLIRKNDGMQDVDTYYIYNEYNQLAFVLPPLASALASIDETKRNSLCYQYRYDDFGRLVEKRIPGKGWEYLVYDKQDRVVLTQDAMLAGTTNNFAKKGWMFTKYDKFGRVAYTGFFANTASRSVMQTAINNMSANAGNNEERSTTPFTLNGIEVYYTKNAFPTGSMTVLSVNYYDTYPPLPNEVIVPTNILGQDVLTQDAQNAAVSTKTLPTATFTKNIEDNGWTKDFIWYDKKGRPIGSHSVNYLGGYTKTESLLDFAGVTQKTNVYHLRKQGETGVTVKERFVYDPQYRLLQHYHQVDSKPEELLTENTYNELSELKNKKVGNNLQSIDYDYNIRGWLTEINKDQMAAADLGGKLFAYKVKYNQKDGISNPDQALFSNKNVTAKYNGNIAETDWRSVETIGVNPSITPKRYGYAYDALNRLSAGYYQNPGNPYSKENTESLDYDVNGNITDLYRTSIAEYGSTTATLIDKLKYDYNGNQATNINDYSYNQTGYEGGGQLIKYDLNGNMTEMPDKGMDIKYNHLNLSNFLHLNRGGVEDITINTKYRADGTKLRKENTTIVSGFSGSTTSKTMVDYLDGFQYSKTESPNTGGGGSSEMFSARAMQPQTFSPEQSGSEKGAPKTADLQFLPTAEGFYDYINDQYIYQYKDHLGNVRVSFARNSAGGLQLKDNNDYYPFGMNHLKTGNSYFGAGSYVKYKFNGVELQETGLYAMDWRNYQADIARFSGVDELSESYDGFSPYHFAMNNPVLYSDPTGMYSTDHNGNYSTTNTDEIRRLQSFFGNGGSVNGVKGLISVDETFKEDIPELVISVSKWHYAFTGDYLTGGDKKTIFNHLDKYIGAMATITQWNGDRGFWGNWANSENFWAGLSYSLANNFYLGLQMIDTFNWMGTKRMSGYTGRLAFSNLDDSSQFDSGNRLMAFATTFNPFGPKMTLNVPASFGAVGKSVLPQAAFRMTEDLAPLSASQFSMLFKGTSIARATPATRGLLNSYLNKGLNGVNSVGLYRTVYPAAAKAVIPHNDHNNR